MMFSVAEAGGGWTMANIAGLYSFGDRPGLETDPTNRNHFKLNFVKKGKISGNGWFSSLKGTSITKLEKINRWGGLSYFF